VKEMQRSVKELKTIRGYNGGRSNFWNQLLWEVCKIIRLGLLQKPLKATKSVEFNLGKEHCHSERGLEVYGFVALKRK
jgi:hypothetical protein